MACIKQIMFLLCTLGFTQSMKQTTSANATRAGKVFSLFNIVQFNNAPCPSTSAISGGSGNSRRNGTCFTNAECSAKGGTNAGRCAAGFGVCCVFLVSSSGTFINQNCTYLRNPNFPGALDNTGDLTYTIAKCDPRVCQLRLDFESFTTLGTGNTEELDANGNGGGRCLDELTITTNSGSRIPVICGQNTGQHIYVDIGCMTSDTAMFNFNFDGQVGMRMWEIKVTQIPCNLEGHPNGCGCLQYHTGLTGRLTTFNFIPTDDNHLRNQEYSICIRQEPGMCCIRYSVCEDANSFTLENLANNQGDVDDNCAGDYVGIEGGASAQCSPNTGGATRTRFCGTRLNTIEGSDLDIPICDCNKPFRVDIFTDDLTDNADGSANDDRSRGVCLNYMQIPC